MKHRRLLATARSVLDAAEHGAKIAKQRASDPFVSLVSSGYSSLGFTSVPSCSGASRPLARQLRRAASSVVLNIAEGSGSSGGNRTARYRTALGSARETLACLRVAEACGYVDSVPGAVLDSMNRVVGTLVRVAA